MQKFPSLFVWAESIIIGGLALLPLLFSRHSFFPYTSVKGYWIILVAVLAISFLITLWLKDRSWKPKMIIPLGLFGVFLIWNIVVSLFGESIKISWWGDFRLNSGFVTQLGILLYAFAIGWIAQKKNIIKQVAAAIALGGVGLVLYLYGGVFSKNPASILSNQMAGGTFGNSSFAAAYLLAAIAGAVVLVFAVKKKWKWVWGVVGIFLITSPVFVNIFGKHDGILSYIGQARAATAAVMVAVIIGLAVYYSFSQKKVYCIIANTVIVVGCIGTTVLGAMLYSPKTSVYEKFSELASGNRFVYHDIALEGIATRPAIGFGWNHFPVAFQQFFDPINLGAKGYAGEAWVNEPHNMLLQVGVSGGIPSIALYLVFLGSIFVCTSIAIRKGVLGRIEGSVLFGFFAAYMLQNIFLFDVPGAQMAFMALLAVACCSIKNSEGFKKSVHRPLIEDKNIRSIVIFIVWAGAIAGAYYFAVRPFIESIAIKKIQTRTQSHILFNKTAHISPQGYVYDEADLAHDKAAGYLPSVGTFSPEQKTIVVKELNSYEELLQQRLETSPDFIRTHVALAYINLVLFKAGNYEDVTLVHKAQSESLKAIRLSPRNQIGYWLMAQSMAFAGDIDMGVKYAEMAVQLEPKIIDSHLVLLNILQFSDDKQLLAQQTKRAQALFPEHQF